MSQHRIANRAFEKTPSQTHLQECVLDGVLEITSDSHARANLARRSRTTIHNLKLQKLTAQIWAVEDSATLY